MKTALCIFAVLTVLLRGVFAQSTAFTYQGRLTENGAPPAGTYDFQLALFDAAAAGTQTGTTGTFEDVSVAGGVFTVIYDPGPNVFTGAPRWLSLSVRPGASTGAYTLLSPRQPVTSTPYAVRAANATSYTGPVADSQLSANVARLNSASQTFSGPVNFSNTANAFSGTFSGTGTGLREILTSAMVVHGSSTPLAWGDTSDGGTAVPANLTRVVKIAALYRSVALKADGSVVEWGDITNGIAPPGLTGLTTIGVGSRHVIGLRQNGTVTGWGSNAESQLNIPAGLTGVTAIAAGWFHNLALKSDGTLVTWGYDTQGPGQLAIPAGLTNVIAVSAGFGHSLALRQNGTVVAWGHDTHGQTVVPAGLAGVVAISANYIHSMALKQDGTVVAWGGSSDGEGSVPAGLSGVTAISAGAGFSLALQQDGTLVGWGYNGEGQTTPPVSTNIAAIAAGRRHALALPRHSPVPFALENRSNTFTGNQHLLSGKLGIDTLTPSALLSLGNGLADTKIALWDQGPGGPSYGLGIQSYQFRLHLDAPEARFSFLDAPAGQELMTIKGTGNVGIGVPNPQAKLDVAGSVRIGQNGTVINNIQTGNAVVGSQPGTGVKIVTVFFPAAFTTPPRVLLTPRGQDYPDVFAATTRSVTTTGFTMNVIRLDAPGAGWGQNLTVDWMATE